MKKQQLIAACLSASLLTLSLSPSLASENAGAVDTPVTEEQPGDLPATEEQPTTPEEPVTPETPSVTIEPEITTTTPAYNDSHQAASGTTVISGILLVNKAYPLPADYAPAYAGSNGQSTTLQGDANAAAQAFLAAANAQGNSMYILSGYRSYNVQSYLFANYAASYGEARANTFSARAGQSEHQTGLAFDVGDAVYSGYNLQTSIDQFPGVQWMIAHCHEYGFILRYPEGKEAITGYQYEPWHFRYVGVEAATAIMSSGLTLEEYLGVADTEAAGGRRMAIGRSDNSLNIDGHYTSVASYNINGNNYFRLRDLATILTGSGAEFDVSYDEALRRIRIQSQTPLSGTPTLIQLDSTDIALPNTMTVLADDRYVAPAAYNIDGFTYFKLRDLGQILGFSVEWDEGARSMVIDTLSPNTSIDNLLASVALRG